MHLLKNYHDSKNNYDRKNNHKALLKEKEIYDQLIPGRKNDKNFLSRKFNYSNLTYQRVRKNK